MTGATSGEGIAYPSGATEFTPVFGGIFDISHLTAFTVKPSNGLHIGRV
jgi:hypothetical protein